MMTYYCPNCDEEKTLGEYQMFWTCEECEHDLELDPDAEFIEGVWHDRPKVIDVTGRHERQMQAIEQRAKEKLQ